MSSKFYVTTPIYYVNDKPHIGHAYTTILADCLARYHRTAGDEVFFLTGLDEHGQKVQQAAEKRGMSPQAHCDDLAPRFTDLWKKLGIQYDDFVRTTQDRHKKIVQAALQKVYDNGDVYEAEYEGWYSVAEERFITDTEKESGQFRDVQRLKEKNYFFKMSKYQKKLIEYIETHPEFIQPQHRKNEILGFLRQPLGDLCISRPKSRLSWGIEIPFAKDYVTYVWFDALINYISIPGWGSDEKKFKKWWPANVHLIGKDILTTHCVYWPTMLFSLGLPLPKTVFAHGWWLIGETKMSKSLGNVINPLDLVDKYGEDAVRYYLMRDMVLGDDANFTLENFIHRYNSDLANDFGNLLNRVSGLLNKHFEGCIPESFVSEKLIHTTHEVGRRLWQEAQIHINSFKIHEAIKTIMSLVQVANSSLEKEAPWKLIKEGNKAAAGHCLYTAAEALRLSAVALNPIMPGKTKIVLDVLGAEGTGLKWGELKSGTKLKLHEALFPRIEVEKK
ncbi:MAG: methionine--tRNA ligase [Omnitrophica WOR_2 bacterium GWA2_47_8]|nr:MAG: methionine--tRNA ligase [Omnitrophica WOR_2 bacterium GWA2_47_8]